MLFMQFISPIVFLISTKLVYSHVSSPDYFEKQSYFIQTGFSNIVWTYIKSSDFQRQNVSSSCKSSLNHVIESLSDGQDWSFKLLDSSGRVPVDFTDLGYIDPGNYDQCLNLNWIGSNGQNEISKYCLASLLPSDGQYSQIYTKNKIIDAEFGLDFQIGFCLPATCSNFDLNMILKGALKPYFWDLVAIRNCEVNNNLTERLMQSTALQKKCLIILSVLILTVLYSTYLDRKDKMNGVVSINKSWIKNFSMISSYRQIVEPNWSTNRMFFLIKAAIYLHSIVLVFHATIWPFFIKGNVFTSLSSGEALIKDSEVPSYFNIDWILEGLFFYGGFARSLELWKSIGSETSLASLLISTLFKLIALSILMAITMFIQIVLPIFISGPSGAAKHNTQACYNSFYKVIFQHNHWVDSFDELCIPHFWSVNSECRYLFLVIILIYLYKRHPKAGLSLNIILLIGSLLIVASLFYMSQYPLYLTGLKLSKPSDIKDFLMYVYARDSMHIWSYMFSTLSVYLVMQEYDIALNKVNLFRIASQYRHIFGVLLTISPAFYLFIIGHNQTSLSRAIYAFTFRTFVLIFYGIVLLNTGEEARRCFSHKDDKFEIDGRNNNDVDKNDSNTSMNRGRVRFLHIVSTILRSSYCIHVPMLVMLINSWRYPILNTGELMLERMKQIIYCLFGGFLFHLFIIGPMNSITGSFKKLKSH